MMQPTPAPTSAPNSPKAQMDVVEDTYPTPPFNTGSAPFSVLASLFDKLQSEKKPERRRKLLDTWFNHWREEKGYDLYSVLRLILPQKDRDRAVYGLKEKNLAKTYIKLIPLGTKDPDAVRMLNWKKPTERDKTSGDFPTVLYEVVNKRSSVIEGSLTVESLNDILDELSKNMGKQDVQSKILQRVYNRSTAEEQRWIIRIILKDMVISVKETTVLSVFHPDAQDLFNTCSDLKKVAWELWDPSRRLREEDKGVQLFRAFAPMLCKRPTRKIEESVKEMQGRKFIIEEKLDGERMQLHKRGNEYFYCSRKGKDYTYLYGKHVGTGSLTPFISSAFDERIDDIILDGEMLVWDPVSERNLPFGTLKTAALDKSKKEHNPRPCFKIFDLLYLNGASLLGKSTKFRKRNMRACIKEITGRIEYAVEWEGKTAKDVRGRMDDVMAARGEGLVIKHPDSEYILNGRNKDWIKVKPEYMDNMGETVDVLVIAGNYGNGKRGGGVSTLICGVIDDRRTNNDDEETMYSSFVRIGSGLSFADYAWVRAKPWKSWDPKSPPSFFQTAKKSHEDKGDVYLEPEDSFIIKVKAAEIVASDQYHVGYTMRFPRALSIRDDLTIVDCVSASEILDSMRAEKKRKMQSDADMTKKKRKINVKKSTVLPEYHGPNLKDVEVETNIFEDIKFMVASDPKSRTGDQDRRELLRLVHANGGTCVQIANNQPSLFVVYGGVVIPYDLQLLMNKGLHDIVKPQWIHDSVARGSLVPLRKRYFFHATAERQEDDEYRSDSEDEVTQDSGPSANQEPVKVKNPDADANGVAADDDPSLADWFKMGDDSEDVKLQQHSETETDDDSDNADVNANAEEDDDDWFKVKPVVEPSSGVVSDLNGSVKDEEPDVKMGENNNVMEYDQDLIFTHLCFYLDSPDNARMHGMTMRSKRENEITQSFAELSKKIVENGGNVVGLDEPKLTHIIIDKRDDSRRLELMRRTSKPKRRHLVIAEYIEACLDESTLLDEDEFVP